MVASVKRGVRRLERAGAQEKHGCRKLSAEAENAQPPGSYHVPRGGSGAICRERSTEAENALPPCLVGDSERNSVSGRLSKTFDRGRERSTPWSRQRLVLLWETGSGSQAQLIRLLAGERSLSSVKNALFLYKIKRALGDSRRPSAFSVIVYPHTELR